MNPNRKAPDGNSSRRVNLGGYKNSLGWRNKLLRAIWNVAWWLLVRPTPVPFFWWRSCVMRCFGAKLGRRASIYPSTRVWAPWNLEMEDFTLLSFEVNCYCVDKVRIGTQTLVSQHSFLCTASHDISDPVMRLVTAPIVIEASVWICADAFIGPGVTIGEGAVVGARACVFKNVEPWTVVGGNPARFLKKRELRSA